jgi:SOS response regulatory protein OraA/RecX
LISEKLNKISEIDYSEFAKKEALKKLKRKKDDDPSC